MMYASLATCPIDFYREQSAKIKAATDAFDKWHETGSMLGIKKIDCFVEIQTRLNRAEQKRKSFSCMIMDLNRMLDDIINPAVKPDLSKAVTFKVHKETSDLFNYYYCLRHNSKTDSLFNTCWFKHGDNAFIKASKKQAWQFIKFASLFALNGLPTRQFEEFEPFY